VANLVTLRLLDWVIHRDRLKHPTVSEEDVSNRGELTVEAVICVIASGGSDESGHELVWVVMKKRRGYEENALYIPCPL